jgi:hypothetical protein
VTKLCEGARARSAPEGLSAGSKGVEDYDWTVIVTGVPRPDESRGKWSAAKDGARRLGRVLIKSASRVRFRATRTSSQYRLMTRSGHRPF